MKMQKCYSHIIAIKSIEYYNYLIIKHLYQYMQCLEVLPINYQSNYRICYHSDYQFGSITFIDSPIDYLLGQLCPIFCVCKSTSYESKWLIYKYLREYKGSKIFCNVLLRFANFGGLVIIRVLPKVSKVLPSVLPPRSPPDATDSHQGHKGSVPKGICLI